MKADVIIIGGGPSGLMAAIAASSHGSRVILVDKGDKLGRKLGISGGGRCNVTNAKETDELIRNIPGNGKFLHSALSQFGNRDIIRFFENMGIRLKEEDRGRMFPVSDKAQTVVQALLAKVQQQGVEIRVHHGVQAVLYEAGQVEGVKLSDGRKLHAPCVVVASGGKSVPHTGSTGDGYAWAKQAGHTITELYPTEVPITSGEALIQTRELQGLSLRSIELSVWNAKGKKLITHEGDMIFTHFGISGPAALRCSQFVVKELKKSGKPGVALTIDLFPELGPQALLEQLRAKAKAEAKKAIKNVLKGIIPERLVPVLLRKTEIPEDMTYDAISNQSWEILVKWLKAFPLTANGTLSLKEAFVTGGGVHLKEVDPKTMASKKMSGLYFCGEILDIHGYTGGYNITAAFSTGYVAGKSAAEYSEKTSIEAFQR